MPLKRNIIEIWETFIQFLIILPFFNNVLFFEPMPLPIYFTKIFNYEAVVFNTFDFFAKDAHSFRMNSKMICIFRRQIINGVIYYSSYFFVLIGVFLA